MTKEFSFSELPEELKKQAIDKFRDTDFLYHDPDWYSPIIEGFKEDMEKIGVEIDDVSFTGFYSQGDGASFTGYVDNRSQFFRLATVTQGGKTFAIGDSPDLPITISEFEELSNEIDELNDPFDDQYYHINFRRTSHHYVHENTCQVDLDIDWDEDMLSPNSWIFYISRLGETDGLELNFNTQIFFEALDKSIEKWRVDTCKKLYRDLERYWDELNSDESIQDHIESMDYQFNCELDDDGNPVNING